MSEPTDPLTRGRQLLAQEQFTAALTAFDAALTARLNHPEALSHFGAGYMCLDEPNLAYEVVAETLRRDPAPPVTSTWADCCNWRSTGSQATPSPRCLK